MNMSVRAHTVKPAVHGMMGCPQPIAKSQKGLTLMDRQLADIGDRVRAARKARGWAIADLAKHAGVAPNTANNVELGRSVRAGNLRAVLDAVEIPPIAATEAPDEDEGVQLALDLVAQWLRAIDDPTERTSAVHELTRWVMLR